MNSAPIDGVSAGGAAALDEITGFVSSPQVNVLYKAFALCFLLIVLAMVPATARFAAWAAWLILLVLLVQKQP